MATLQELEAEMARRQGGGTPAPAPANPEADRINGLIAEQQRRQQEGGSIGSKFSSVASGVRSGVEAMAGAGGDLVQWEKRKAAQLARSMGADEATVKAIETYGDSGNTSGPGIQDTPTIMQNTDAAVNAVAPKSIAQPIQDTTRYQPQNEIERALNTAGGFLPEALMPAKSIATRAMRVAIPTAAVEGAGAVAHQVAPEYEDAARAVAGILGGAAQGLREGRSLTGTPDVGWSLKRKLGTDPKAVERVQQILLEQGMSPDQAAEAMKKLGPQSTLMDTGPVARQEAQQIQARGGEGRGLLDLPLRERETSANARLEGDVETAVGPRLQRSETLQALEDRKAALGPEYDAAHAAQQGDVPTEPIRDNLDSELGNIKSPAVRTKLKQIRDSLHIMDKDGVASPNLDPSSEGLHNARKAIDDMLYDQAGRPRDIGANEARILQGYRKQIDEALGTATPIKAVDEKRAQIGKEERAFTQGEEVFENPRGAPSEVEFKTGFDSMSPGEKARLAEGVNVETWRQLGINTNDRVALKKLLKGEGKWNQQKVAAVVGDEKAQALMDALSREATFSETYQKVVQGSKTAESSSRAKGGGGVVGAAADAARDALAGFTVGGTGGALAGGLGSIGRRLRDVGRNDPNALDPRVAKLLASQRPDDVPEAVSIINGRSVLPAAVRAALLARQQELSRRKED